MPNPIPDSRTPVLDPRLEPSWGDEKVLEQLSKRLLRECRRGIWSMPAEDRVQEVLLKMRNRLPAKAIDEVIGLAIKILRDLEVDEVRRKRPLLQGRLERHHPQVAAARPASADARVFATVRKLFTGRVQRAILDALQAGESYMQIASSLGMEPKEVRRVGREMRRRLDVTESRIS